MDAVRIRFARSLAERLIHLYGKEGAVGRLEAACERAASVELMLARDVLAAIRATDGPVHH